MPLKATEFAPLFEEICRRDCYGLRQVSFVPNVVLDIGANVGVFTMYARFLFPRARIVAVEPDPRNWQLLEQHTAYLPNVTRINKALGTGPIWRAQITRQAPWYGGMESYVSQDQLGFPGSQLADNPMYNHVPHVQPVSLATLVQEHTGLLALVLVKIDIEGGENCIFNHPLSMAALRQIDHLVMEVHYAVDGTGPVYEDGKPTIRESLMSLSDTHDCILDEGRRYFRAIKKDDL